MYSLHCVQVACTLGVQRLARCIIVCGNHHHRRLRSWRQRACRNAFNMHRVSVAELSASFGASLVFRATNSKLRCSRAQAHASTNQRNVSPRGLGKNIRRVTWLQVQYAPVHCRGLFFPSTLAVLFAISSLICPIGGGARCRVELQQCQSQAQTRRAGPSVRCEARAHGLPDLPYATGRRL